MLILGTHKSGSPLETRRLAENFARQLKAGSTVVLIGELGAGKTEFVRGIARALGVDKLVASPSFVRLHAYGGNPSLYHADFYLAKSEVDAADYGLEDSCIQDGIVLIEWGDRFPNLIPPKAWKVTILRDATNSRSRVIEITVSG